MSFVQEFREFAVRGNVVDLAVGIIIGAAFGKIVSSFVNDIVTPPLGYLIGGVNFRDLAIRFPSIRAAADPVTINYGAFLQNVFDFMIVAFAIFIAVKAINRLKRKEPPPPVTAIAPPRQEVLLEEIRDLLKTRQ